MNITIITSENRRLYPAMVYSLKDKEQKNPIINIDDIYDLLYKNESIRVISAQFDQYGKELKLFNGQLDKTDIKAMFLVQDTRTKNELECVMTLSEAAKKWGLADGSTIRKAIERGKFEQNEVKQAGNVWVTSYSAMERVFGPIKDKENTYVIYDDFESLYMNKDYWRYVQNQHCEDQYYVFAAEKENEFKYKYLKEIIVKALKELRNNKKIIIKKSECEEIKKIIEDEREFYLYIELFSTRNILPAKWCNKLIEELKLI